MAQPEVVTLRTGAEVPKVMVNVTLINLQYLLESDPYAFYDLVMLARNPQHPLWGDAGAKFESLALTQGGKLHNTTRDVVVASVEGDDFDMTLVNPVAS